MECDPLFFIELKRNGNQVFNVNWSTVAFKDNFDFGDVLLPNISNPIVVNLDTFEVRTFTCFSKKNTFGCLLQWKKHLPLCPMMRQDSLEIQT